jgi:hypothetical protein
MARTDTGAVLDPNRTHSLHDGRGQYGESGRQTVPGGTEASPEADRAPEGRAGIDAGDADVVVDL